MAASARWCVLRVSTNDATNVYRNVMQQQALHLLLTCFVLYRTLRSFEPLFLWKTIWLKCRAKPWARKTYTIEPTSINWCWSSNIIEIWITIRKLKVCMVALMQIRVIYVLCVYVCIYIYMYTYITCCLFYLDEHETTLNDDIRHSHTSANRP